MDSNGRRNAKAAKVARPAKAAQESTENVLIAVSEPSGALIEHVQWHLAGIFVVRFVSLTVLVSANARRRGRGRLSFAAPAVFCRILHGAYFCNQHTAARDAYL